MKGVGIFPSNWIHIMNSLTANEIEISIIRQNIKMINNRKNKKI